MATKSSEQNQFFNIKTKIKMLKLDIGFLKDCKQNNIIPKFVQLYTTIKNDRTEKVLTYAKKYWIKLELEHHYANLQELELKAYYLHIKLTSEFNKNNIYIYWQHFEANMNEIINHKSDQKSIILERKLNILKSEQVNINITRTYKHESKFIDNMVHNFSSYKLNENEEHLLNKGLKFAIPPISPPIEDLVVSIHSAIRYWPESELNNVTHESSKILKDIKYLKCSKKDRKFYHTIKNLRDNDIIISKADKGNNIVIMDKSDYIHRMNLMIESSNNEILVKNPLTAMISEVNKTLNKHKDEIEETIQKLKVSNPQIPRMYGLAKIHKADRPMRPISSNINAPTEKIAKWLVSEFRSIKSPTGLTVKNGIDFVDKMKNIRITRNEILVSFDVTSLFPNVPIPYTLNILREWLMSNDISNSKIDMYVDLAKLCMNQNIFQFDNKIYKQHFGTSMGNSLSAFMAELFLCDFETNLSKHHTFPRIWYRYVDDVFAICNQRKVDYILSLLNSQHKSIQFTCEREQNNKLPFLDIMVEKIGVNLEFDIYRKPTSCNRFIVNESYHHFKHKMAAFHSMIHRLLHIPLSPIKFKTELDYIYELADLNGYGKTTIKNIFNKHKRKVELARYSTFYEIQEEPLEKPRISLPFHSIATPRLQRIFNEHERVVVHKTKNTLHMLLGSAKDKIPPLQRSGIYEIKCQDDCDFVYYGMTVRNPTVRLAEHLYQFKKGNMEKSSVAKHLLQYNHFTNITKLKLVKEVNNKQHMECIEAIHIRKNMQKNLMNGDLGNVYTPLMKLI